MDRPNIVRLRKRFYCAIFIFLMAVGLGVWHFVPTAEENGLAGLFWTRGSIAPPIGVAIIDIQRVGRGPLTTIEAPELDRCRWTDLDVRIGPWPRCGYAELLDRLIALGAVTVSFDIGFHSKGNQRDNERLAKSIESGRNVVLQEGTESEVELATGASDDLQGHSIRSLNETIRKDALGRAPFILPKAESVISFPTFHNTVRPAATFSTLSLFAFESLKDDAAPNALAQKDIHTQVGTVYEKWLHEQSLPDWLTPVQRRLITEPTKRYFNIYGGPRTLPVYSGIEILNGNIEPDLTGLAVFVGQAELNRFQQDDSFPTVFTDTRGIFLSGVELAGTAFLNLQHNDDIKRLSWPAALALLIVTALSFTYAAIQIKFTYCLSAIALIGVTYAIASHLLFVSANLWIPIFAIGAQAVPAGMFGGYLRYRRLREAKNKIVPSWAESFVDIENDTPIRFGTLNAICLRSDLSGYTRLGLSLELVDYPVLMNNYFTAVKAKIDKWGGDFANPSDDSYLVFWPISDEHEMADRVVEACCAAVEASEVLKINSMSGETHSLRARIGLSFGKIAAGSVGDANAYSFNITGNPVNLTARIESINKLFGTNVLCDTSLGILSDRLHVRPLGRFLLRDQNDATDLVEIKGLAVEATESSRTLVTEFAAALALLQNHQIADANEKFKALLVQFPDDGPTKFYVDFLETNTETGDRKGEIPVISLTQREYILAWL